MDIIKRSGDREQYDSLKIQIAIGKAFASTGQQLDDKHARELVMRVESINAPDHLMNVEEIQDTVERVLMESKHYDVAKNYILYRERRRLKRVIRQNILAYFPECQEMKDVLRSIESDFPDERYDLNLLLRKFQSFYKENKNLEERIEIIIKAAIELTDKDATKWEFIAARFYDLLFNLKVQKNCENRGIYDFYSKLVFLTEDSLYGKEVLDNYTREEIEQAYSFIDIERNKLLNYSGYDILASRYVIHDRTGLRLETVQEMFLGIALFLAIPETDKMIWVRRFYDMLSLLKVTMATPTLSNARKPYHQLSSCFIDTVPDSLEGIYRSISNFANVSKFGGGMGLYFGKVRAAGSDIRGFKGAAGGVIRWIRLANDTAVAVDQLGVRQGAVAVYLDVWHKDIPEFLALRTNNGDDRMKAHDVFPAVCYPNYFWEQVENNLEGEWALLCPHEVRTIKGYALEDYFGDEWTEKYLECINDERISKKYIPLKELVRLIIKSEVETGTPFAFNRDLVNEANPNSHKGMIYCSNLCTEIAQNMSAIDSVSQTVETLEGDEVVVTTTKPGNFVVCNLASLNLGKIDVDDDDDLNDTIIAVTRALDNVIDLNFFPVPYAKLNNMHYRPIGLGVSGYHHLLALKQILWESEQHIEFVDKLFEKINYFTISASCQNAIDKGKYDFFDGSEWDTGEYFVKRNYNSDKWNKLREKVHEFGLRNAYLLAIAPTSSTSIVAGTTPGIDPIMGRFYYDEKKNGLIPRVAPDLSESNYWYYKNAHYIDQHYSIRACGARSRHIDQAQSMNLYITNDYTFRQVLKLYLDAYKNGVKTVYYIRSKSLEITECESCSS